MNKGSQEIGYRRVGLDWFPIVWKAALLAFVAGSAWFYWGYWLPLKNEQQIDAEISEITSNIRDGKIAYAERRAEGVLESGKVQVDRQQVEIEALLKTNP